MTEIDWDALGGANVVKPGQGDDWTDIDFEPLTTEQKETLQQIISDHNAQYPDEELSLEEDN